MGAPKVKPLVWRSYDGNYPVWRSSAPYMGGVLEVKIDKSGPLIHGRFPLYISHGCIYRWDGEKHQNLKSAKAAAQRILSALDLSESE